MTSPAAPEVSVVIATLRRPRLLARCLEALLAQDLGPRQFEVIVCDDGPDHATRALSEACAIAALARGVGFSYLPPAGSHGPAAARNRGWHAARAAVIAFTDDDTVPDRGWLSAGLGALRRLDADAVAGRIEVPLPEHATDYELDAAGLEKSEFATANCFVRRLMLERVGGFDERYSAAWREDSDLHFSILEAGGRVARADTATVVHPVRPARWGVSIGQARKSRFEALLFKKHPAYYRERIAPDPPWSYYAIVASLVVFALAALGGAAHLAIAALASWLLMTGRFAARRLRRASRHPLHVAEMVWTSMLIPPLAVAWRLYGAFKYKVAFL